jgi:hypothetical protein
MYLYYAITRSTNFLTTCRETRYEHLTLEQKAETPLSTYIVKSQEILIRP